LLLDIYLGKDAHNGRSGFAVEVKKININIKLTYQVMSPVYEAIKMLVPPENQLVNNGKCPRAMI
jgi:hypothetical protein